MDELTQYYLDTMFPAYFGLHWGWPQQLHYFFKEKIYITNTAFYKLTEPVILFYLSDIIFITELGQIWFM